MIVSAWRSVAVLSTRPPTSAATPRHIEKLDYMHWNPVKSGLVASPEQWRWSSDRYYSLGEEGPVKIDA
jgi:hypothetical protein